MTATTTAHQVTIAQFLSLASTRPRPVTLPWPDLARLLTRHSEQDTKDGPGWSPTVYEPGQSRGNNGVVEMTMAVLDLDHTVPDWRLIEDLEYVAHTTYSHTSEDPHWRLVFPLEVPVPVTEWPVIWRRIFWWLQPTADPACKDPARFYWLPSHPEGTEPEGVHHHGTILDWRQLRDVPEDFIPPNEPHTNGTTNGERPGDRYNAETDWAEILEPAGWQLLATLGPVRRWQRPENGMPKKPGCSATSGGGGHDVLYVFSSNAAPFDPNTSYTKFRAFSLLHHGGDDHAAARALYGEQHEHQRLQGTKQAEELSDESSTPDLHWTDMGNAERLVDQYGEELRYCHVWKSWLIWDGQRWLVDHAGAVTHRAKLTIRQMLIDAAAIAEDNRRKELIKHALKSEARPRVEAMVALAASEPRIPIAPDALDADLWLLNVQNGTINLHTGELQPHDPENLITKLAPYPWDPDATCPVWTAFLERLQPEPAMRDFLQRAVGYCLTGDTGEQALFFFHGEGSNGKSTFLKTILDLMGGYGQQAAPELLTVARDDRHPTGLADLFGARLVATIEIDEGKRLAESLVKQMTGGDRMKARRLFQDFFEWTPTHKVFIAANHRPEIRGQDHAIWRRIYLIPWTVTIPDEEQDHGLMDKLHEEMSGILRWAVDGCLAWQRDGLGVPETVRSATKEYRAEQNIIGRFISECCVLGETYRVTAKRLYAAYCAWCEEGQGEQIKQQGFGRQLTRAGFDNARDMTTRYWLGLDLIQPEGLQDP